MKFLKNTYSTLLASMALAVAAVGCSDELDYPHSTVEPGLPATISVNVSLPEMTPITRADIDPNLENQVSSLWIGVYAQGGKRTGSKFVTGNFGNAGQHNAVNIKEQIDALTGKGYIVAVANYEGRKCLDAEGNPQKYEDALKDADTFEKFKGISAMFNDQGEIGTDVPQMALLMSGHYLSNHTGGDYTEPETVEIIENTELTDSIHLRRLMSQVKFNVTYDTDNIKDFKIVSYQVKNVPNQSWLYESTYDSINAGDNRKVGVLGSYQTSEPYTQVEQTQITVKENNKDVTKNALTFDWWQMENKRTGLDPNDVLTAEEKIKYKDNLYAYRELEHKESDGTNSTKYRSLVAKKDDVDNSNNATFLEMKVRMTMKKQLNENNVLVDIPSNQQRVVDATYTIHLGYCDNNFDTSSSKERDFNCRRNSIYTYNVNIVNVNNILVEARKEGEPTPGAEGIITDVSERYVQLDAHYGLYNLYLDASDLKTDPNDKDGKTGFRFQIECYDANKKLIEIDSDSSFDKDGNLKNTEYQKYLDWIEIAKTPSNTDKKMGESILSCYHPDNVFKINEFRKKAEAGELSSGWYTIFFNEYVYEGDKWSTYVNKPDRKLWIRVREKRSNDKESVLYTARYAFSQKSIQTFYGSNSTTALGLEHDNESFGLNLRNSFNSSSDGTDPDNGRYNTWLYVQNKSWSNLIEYSEDNDGELKFNSLQEIQGINNTNVKDTTFVARTIKEGNPVPLPALVNTATAGNISTTYDPDQTSQKYYEAITACMNRNRDLDGDGEISANELRWYVPTTEQYTQIVLGAPSLTNPIMNYSANGKISTADPTTNMHLILYGSNGQVLWAMEGFSTSDWNGTWEKDKKTYYSPTYTRGAPWDLRCVRNLGTDNSVEPSEGTPEIDNAFVADLSSRKVKMTNYDSKSYRSIDKIDAIKPHDISDKDRNKAYRSFEYAENNMEMKNAFGYSTYKDNWAKWITNVNPCKEYGDKNGWRVPNQQELMILKSIGVVPPTVKDYNDRPRQFISGTFAHYKNGNAIGANHDYVNDAVKFMCVTTTNGNSYGTQMDWSNNGVNDNSSYHMLLRCVRDVDD